MSNPLPSMPPARPMAIPVDAPSSTWDRISSWVSENKAVVYTIAGVAVVVTGAGVVYYLNSDSVRLGILISHAMEAKLCAPDVWIPKRRANGPHAPQLITYIQRHGIAKLTSIFSRRPSQTHRLSSARRRDGREKKPSARLPRPRNPPQLPPKTRPPPWRAKTSSPRLTRTA